MTVALIANGDEDDLTSQDGCPALKTIYDSGPYSLLVQCFAVLWALVLFMICIALASFPFFALGQNVQQPWTQLFILVVVLPFVSLLVCAIAGMGLSVVSPVYFGFRWRVYLSGSDIEVEKAFAFHLFIQKLDRNRINCIEVIQKRRGGTIISVLHRFDQARPRLSDTVHIGPFWNHNEAQADADAIQAELMPENQDAGQIKQMQKFETQFVSRFVIGCLIVFEMIVGFDLFFKWSRMGPVEWLIAAWMAVVPWIILYSVTREINTVRKANTPH